MNVDAIYRRTKREAFCRACSAVPGDYCRDVHGAVKAIPHVERLAFLFLLDAEIASLSSVTPTPPCVTGGRSAPPPPSGVSFRPLGGTSDGIFS